MQYSPAAAAKSSPARRLSSDISPAPAENRETKRARYRLKCVSSVCSYDRFSPSGVFAIKKRKLWVLLALAVLLAALYGADAFHLRQFVHRAAKTAAMTALRIEYRLTGRDDPVFVPVLMYHSVSETPIGDPALSVRPAEFAAQMQALADGGFTPITFDELADAAKFQKPILITFDDGYRDNFTEAYPILKKHGFHATVFLISGDIGAPNFINGGDILAMSDLVSFQSHTVRHYRLPDLSEDDAALELRQSKETIEALTGKRVIALSYPEGRYNRAVRRLARKYYDCAVTTKCGYWHSGADRYSIRRLAVGRGMKPACFQALIDRK